MPLPSTRFLLAGGMLAALVLAGPARADADAAEPTAAVLKSSIDKAIYMADKARSTADKARIAGYVTAGFGLLTTLGVATLLVRGGPVRGGAATTAVSAVPGRNGKAGTTLADLARLFADRRQRRIMRRQQDLARAMADLSATFTLYQDQAKEVDTVMLSIREKLARLDAEVPSS